MSQGEKLSREDNKLVEEVEKNLKRMLSECSEEQSCREEERGRAQKG